MKVDNSKDNNLNKLKVKSIILSIVFFIFLIISIIFFKKVKVFSFIFTNTKSFIIFIYFFLISLNLIYNIGLCIYAYFFNENKKIEEIYKKTIKILDLPIFVCYSFSILFFIVIFVFTPCNVSGDSMNDTYKDKDKVICSDLFYTPKKGDVIVFDSTKYTHTNGDLYIKRVLATEGDILTYNSLENKLYINENPSLYVTYEQYMTIIAVNQEVEYKDSYTVPKNKLLVIGDNRRISYDSRYFGLIEKKDVFGKVLFRLYPFGNPKTMILE